MEHDILFVFKEPKVYVAAVGGLFISWFGRVWVLIFLVFAAILLDYLTGILAARANEGLNSRRATHGIYKKMGLFLMLVLGFLLDVAFNHFVMHGFSFQIPFDMPIGLIISVWIVITEAISICENLERLGVHIPPGLKHLLRKMHKEIESEDEKL